MIQISKEDQRTVLVAMLEAYPIEACGFMAGNDGKVSRLYPVENVLNSPHAYYMDPTQQLEAMLDLEERGLEMLAIYHSHPHGPAIPSLSDIAQAAYPDSAYVIISLVDKQQPSFRAFTIVDGRVKEIPYRVT
jgi:proteasome lid subunit RPN8/RPN11